MIEQLTDIQHKNVNLPRSLKSDTDIKVYFECATCLAGTHKVYFEDGHHEAELQYLYLKKGEHPPIKTGDFLVDKGCPDCGNMTLLKA